jgi:hypothetical protein
MIVFSLDAHQVVLDEPFFCECDCPNGAYVVGGCEDEILTERPSALRGWGCNLGVHSLSLALLDRHPLLWLDRHSPFSLAFA